MKKKSFLSIFKAVVIVCSFSGAYGQSSVVITNNLADQTVVLSADQVLEVKLSSDLASAGYGWYPKATSDNVVTAFGDWQFEPAHAGETGTAGIQTTKFVGVSAGQTSLELEYIQPWEKNVPAISSFKINVVSKGKYSGIEKPYLNKSEISKKELPVSNSTLPSKFSWKDQNIMTPIKHQVGPTCWAYATCGVFEALINAEDGVVRDLAEAALISCASGGGAAFAEFVPPTGNGCAYEQGFTDCSTAVYHEQASAWKTVSNGVPPVDTIKNYIYNYGPVYVGVCAAFMDFQNYNGGIFSGMGSAVDHAVILCGWSDSAGGYWIMRNSWGAGWGESGYMRIAWNSNKIGTGMAWLKYKNLLNQTTTAVTENNANTSLTVFPSPAPDGNFNVSLSNSAEEKYELTIDNMLGQTIYRESISGKTINKAISLPAVQKGIYIINMTGMNGAYNSKLIIQ
jgi:predicted secreted protein